MENEGADMSIDGSDSLEGADSLCDAMESVDCEPKTNIETILMGECDIHFKRLQEEYAAANKEQDMTALDDWFIDECCDVLTGIMAGANECMSSETILVRMRELFDPFLQSGYLNEELLFEYMTGIYMEYQRTRDGCNVLSSLENKYKACTHEPLLTTDDSSEEDTQK